MHRSIRIALLATTALALGAAVAVAAPKEAKRYGIKGVFREYDAARGVFKIDVTSNETTNFGGSTAGDKAPSDVEIGKPIELAVKPEGSVLSRTVIKSTQGTGLDNTGTADGFAKAVKLIPSDRSIVFSISKNESGTPAYRLNTAFIPLTDAEIQRRIKEFTEGKDGNDPSKPSEASQ
jgi:hypothetical protein